MSRIKITVLFCALTLSIDQTIVAGNCCSFPNSFCTFCDQEIKDVDFSITDAEICGLEQYNGHCFHLKCFFKLRTEQPEKLAELCGATPLTINAISSYLYTRGKKSHDISLMLRSVALSVMALEYKSAVLKAHPDGATHS